jgi:membrane-associated phospholipid phosphatase
MNSLRLLRRNLFFFTPYSLLLIGAGIWQILYRQGIIALDINRLHHPWADIFFKYITFLGDGLFCVILAAIYFFWSKQKGIALFLSYAISGIIAQSIKKFGFPKEPRPAEYFADMMTQIHTVTGVELSHWNSFPSGHTASAFAVFTLLAFWSKTPALKVCCLILAALVGYSRLYLFQHFLIDVYVGSILGTIVAVLVTNKWTVKIDE